MLRRLLATLAPLVLVAVLAACGGDDGGSTLADGTVTQPPPRTATTPPATTTTPPPATTTTPAPPPATTPAQPPRTTAEPSGGNGGATPPATTPAGPPEDGGGAAAGPAACPNAVGGFIRDVQASSGDCELARQVADAWFDAVNDGTPPDAAITAAGYACSGSLSGQRASVSCSGGDGATVTFTASP